MTGNYSQCLVIDYDGKEYEKEHPNICVVVQLLSCVLLFCDPMDYNPPDSSVHGIFQTRILEWVVISFSRGSSRPRDRTQDSCLAGRCFTTEPPGKPYNGEMLAINMSDENLVSKRTDNTFFGQQHSVGK